MPKKLTTEEFIIKAITIHGDLYDYSKVVYKNAKMNVIIIDPIYGEFEQIPTNHLSGQGHPKRGIQRVADKKRSTKEDFIIKAITVHGDLYDYSKVVYKNTKMNVIIIDPIYGEFEQRPAHHLGGSGHIKRGIQKRADNQRSTKEDFIIKAIAVHGDLYDYSKVIYKNNNTKIIIIDPIYGEFEQIPSHHIRGCGHQSRAEHGFNPEKPAILYLLSLKKYNKKQQKVGITEKSVEKRFSKRKMVNVQSFREIKFESGYEALNVEQAILKMTKAHSISVDECLIPDGDGVTEIRTCDMVPFFKIIESGMTKNKTIDSILAGM